MARIRPEQIEALEQSAQLRFEDEMVRHLGQFAPGHCRAIGEPAVREVIRLGMQRAGTYGLTRRGPVRFYIELMFLLGSDFDTDPQYPWASWGLNGRWTDDQMARADQLHARLQDYLDKTAGPGRQYALDAMRTLRDTPPGSLAPSAAGRPDALFREMERIYPRKCRYVGDRPLRALIARGEDLARTHGLTSDRGAALFTALIFVMGHGLADDPLHPWVAKTLRDASITDPDELAERLEARARTYLARALKNLERR